MKDFIPGVEFLEDGYISPCWAATVTRMGRMVGFEHGYETEQDALDAAKELAVSFAQEED